jgi:hypothetical protein
VARLGVIIVARLGVLIVARLGVDIVESLIGGVVSLGVDIVSLEVGIFASFKGGTVDEATIKVAIAYTCRGSLLPTAVFVICCSIHTLLRLSPVPEWRGRCIRHVERAKMIIGFEF